MAGVFDVKDALKNRRLVLRVVYSFLKALFSRSIVPEPKYLNSEFHELLINETMTAILKYMCSEYRVLGTEHI